MASSRKPSWRERESLRSLERGLLAMIEHKASADDEPVVIADLFPKAIIDFFAPNLPSVTVCDETQSQIVIIELYTVVGGRESDVKAIFSWMRNSCRGEGLLQWPRYEWTNFAFNKLWHLRTASQAVTCYHLEKEFQYRMQLLSGHHIHASDVELTYNEAGPSSEMGEFLVSHVASAILGRMVADKGLEAYAAICERNKEFDQQLDDMIGLRLAFRAKLKGEDLWELKRKRNRPKKKVKEEGEAAPAFAGGD